MITLNQNMRINQSYVIRILIALIHIVTEDFFVDISDGVERWFDTSNYDDENHKIPLPIGKNEKVI